MKFRLKTLNQKGFDHILVLVVFIVLFGAVGSYLLVESHAAVSTYNYYYDTYNHAYCLMDIGGKAELSTCSSNVAEARATKVLINNGPDFTVKINSQCLQYSGTSAIFAGCTGDTDQWWENFNQSIEPFSTSTTNFCMGTTRVGGQIVKSAGCNAAFEQWMYAAAPVTVSPTPGPGPAPVSSGPTGTSLTTIKTLPSNEYCVSYEFYYEEPNAWGTQCVKDLQQMIYDIGEHHSYSGFVASENYPPDGEYATNTEAQVKAFQAQHGLTGSQTDGVVGENTWSKLCSYVNETPGTFVYTNAGCKTGKFGNARYPL